MAKKKVKRRGIVIGATEKDDVGQYVAYVGDKEPYTRIGLYPNEGQALDAIESRTGEKK